MKCCRCESELVENSRYCNFCGAKQKLVVPCANSIGDVDKKRGISKLKSAGTVELQNQTAISGKLDDTLEFEWKKPERIPVWIAAGCGAAICILILLFTIGAVFPFKHVALAVDKLPETTVEESINITGSTDEGNRLLINGIDYSSYVEENGKFKIGITLKTGKNEIKVSAMKNKMLFSKSEETLSIKREPGVFEPVISPVSGSVFDGEEIEVKGKVNASGAVISINDDKIHQETTSNSDGMFKLNIGFYEIGVYNFTLRIEKEGYETYEQPYTLERTEQAAVLAIDYSTLGVVADKTVVIKGKTEPEGRVSISGDLAGEITAGKDGAFYLELEVTRVGSYMLRVTASKTGCRSTSEEISFIRDISQEEKLQDYKEDCREIDYKALKKNTDKYIGAKVKYYGKVIDIRENENNILIMMAVTKFGRGIWNYNDMIAVSFNSKIDIKEEDVISVYGKVKGEYSYAPIAGWKVTIPEIEAEYIERQ